MYWKYESRLGFHKARGKNTAVQEKLWQPSKALSLKHSWTVQIQQSFFSQSKLFCNYQREYKRNSMLLCIKKAAPLNYSKNAFCSLYSDKAWGLKTEFSIQWPVLATSAPTVWWVPFPGLFLLFPRTWTVTLGSAYSVCSLPPGR